jgi:hypothetical protein
MAKPIAIGIAIIATINPELVSRTASDSTRRVLGGAVIAACVLFHLHSPLLVGRDLAERLERWGGSPIALGLLWGAMAMVLARGRLARAAPGDRGRGIRLT